VSAAGRYLALPVKSRAKGRNGWDVWRPDGWAVYRLPFGNNSRAAGRYRGPWAKLHAQAKARGLNRKAGSGRG